MGDPYAAVVDAVVTFLQEGESMESLDDAVAAGIEKFEAEGAVK